MSPHISSQFSISKDSQPAKVSENEMNSISVMRKNTEAQLINFQKIYGPLSKPSITNLKMVETDSCDKIENPGTVKTNSVVSV